MKLIKQGDPKNLDFQPVWKAFCGTTIRSDDNITLLQKGCKAEITYTSDDLFVINPPLLGWRCPCCGLTQFAQKDHRFINVEYPDYQTWLRRKEESLISRLAKIESDSFIVENKDRYHFIKNDIDE